MDNIDKWLKSLRLHKYTHLFNSLTYEQMLNLEENYLIEREVTKGARNKMLVSIKKLNLREERLINMIEDIIQDNISMKEALTTLKDMLITPIPSSSPQQQPSSQQQRQSNISLGQLFIETVEKVAQRLIESAGMEDSACHGIIASIVDECLKHNSFTKEQKAIVAGFKNHFTKEQKAKLVGFKQHFTKEQQKANVASFKQQHQQSLRQQQQQQQQRPHSYYQQQYHHQHQHLQQILLKQQQQQQQNQHQHSFHHNQQHQLQQYHHHLHHQQQLQSQLLNNCIYKPSSISASLSTIGSASSDTEEEQSQQNHHQQEQEQDQQERQTYKEYSLLGPSMTFELPCLRAAASARPKM